MTSNLGANHLDAAGAAACPNAHQRVIAEVQRRFRPELINRLDDMVVFRPLSGDTLRKVVRLQLGGLAARLAGRGIGLDVRDGAVDAVLSKSSGQVPAYGARPIKRCLQSMVVTRISRMMMQGEVQDGCKVSIDADGAELVFSVEKPVMVVEATPPIKFPPAPAPCRRRWTTTATSPCPTPRSRARTRLKRHRHRRSKSLSPQPQCCWRKHHHRTRTRASIRRPLALLFPSLRGQSYLFYCSIPDREAATAVRCEHVNT